MNYKKIVFILFIFFISLNVYSQEKSLENNSSQEVVQEDSPESKFVFTDVETPSQETVSRPSSSWNFIKVVLVLAIVVACIYFVMNYMRKSLSGDSEKDDMYLRKVAYLNIAPGKSVQVVTLLDKGYIIGVSESSVNLISTIEDKELIEAMNINADKSVKLKKAMNFSEVLEMILPSKSTKETEATKTNIYSDTSKSTKDFISQQRKRINRNRNKES